MFCSRHPTPVRHLFSRREFLKYTLAAGGLLLSERWLCGPIYSMAAARPKVVSVYDAEATRYDYITGYHWEYVNQKTVNQMMERGITALSGKTDIKEAWRSLIPYQPGEKIAIKFNFNNSSDCTKGYDNNIDPLPETANAIIEGLMSIGVPGDHIWITDPSKRVSDRFREGIANPDVQYYSARTCAGPNYHSADYVAPNSPDASAATCPAGEKILPSEVLVAADHLINVPIFKSHGRYVTLALKNHYGSVLFEHYDRHGMHVFFNEGKNTAGCDLNTTNILADINNNPHIKNKTRLVIGEGLFGNAHRSWEDTEPWAIFGHNDPNMLFFSQDPVAISSVMTDYIMAERGWQDHEQLHAAASLGLGVHDHWDAFETKTYGAIDYVPIDQQQTTINRLDIDRIILDFKADKADEKQVKNMIRRYMEGT